MLHASTQKLIDRLAEMTERGRLGWGQEDDQSVVYMTEGYSVSITADPHELVIFSKEGKELERASHADLLATPSGAGTYGDILATMFQQASRIARGTEAAINSLLAGIETEEQTEAEAPAHTDLDAPDDAAASALEDPINETEPVFGAPSEDQIAPAPVDTADELSEPHVTEAVARMADEVNQTEQAASPAAETDAPDTPDAPESVEAAPVKDDQPTFSYLPFGLVAEMEQAAASPDLSPVDTAPEATETPDEPVAEAAQTDDEVEASDEAVIEAVSAPETMDQDEDAASDSDEGLEDDGLSSGNVVDFVATFAPTETFAPAAPEETGENDTSGEEIESEVDTDAPAGPESLSLGSIGAGFGLGALAATNDTGDDLGVSDASAAEPAEKIIIDAIDDVPPLEPKQDTAFQRTADPLPDLASLDTGSSALDSDAEEATGTEEGEDDEALKPKTRFNPWN
ncbi:MAG: hypothetical protein AAF613_01755 [Pseudomonadota bacterium]